jgi:hypothetical protein
MMMMVVMFIQAPVPGIRPTVASLLGQGAKNVSTPGFESRFGCNSSDVALRSFVIIGRPILAAIAAARGQENSTKSGISKHIPAALAGCPDSP